MVVDERHTDGLALTSTEARRIVRLIRPDLDRYAAKFDAQKYPPTTYQHLLDAFRTPSRATAADIRLAILWKFGHLGKARIPAHHERLILELQQSWSEVASVLLGSTREAFDRLTALFGGRYRYITMSFLAHLLRPRDVPIIDQHNFRAMNYYISGLRPGWRSKARPSAYEDLALLAAFIRSVRATWRALDPSTHPSERTLDQFLMMFGKGLKGGANDPTTFGGQRTKPTAAAITVVGERMKPVFTHCALHVRDLEKSVAFYREFCGLKIVEQHGEGSNDHAVWMTEDGREGEYVFVLLLGGLGHQQRDADLSHFGFAVGRKSEVDEVADRGRAAGILAWAPKEFPFPVGYRCALHDPDGYIVEFSYGQPLGPGVET